MRKIFFVVLICLIGVMVGFVSAEEKIPIPEFYGLYFVSDGNLIPARDAVSENRTKRAGALGTERGVKELSGIFLSPNSYFLLYQKLVAGLGSLRLHRLEFHEANMWILGKEIPLNVGPVKEQLDLYRLVPTLQLEDGVYAFIDMGYFDNPSMEFSVADFVVGKPRPPAQMNVTYTKATLMLLHSAVNQFKMDTGRFPSQEAGLKELVEQPSDVTNWEPGGYLGSTEIPKDGWGNEFIYERFPESGKPFVVRSLGADGKEGGEGYDADLYSTEKHLEYSVKKPEKITIDSLTKNLPYGNYNTGRFQAIEKTYNVTFDDAWAAINKVISEQREAITTSDRDKGILIGQGEGIGVKHWTAATIEKITEYSIKVTVKSIGYRVQGNQTVNLGPINFQIKTKSDAYRGVTVDSYNSIIHNNLEKELKSKEKQPPYSVAVDGKEYKVSGDIFTGKKEGRVFKGEKGTVVRDLNLAKKIAQAAWVYENIVKAPGIPASQRVSAILETHKALRRYELTQDILARASVQILAATISGGATLTYAAPAGLTWRVVRDQFVNLKGLLSLTGRQGLEEALSKYQQMEALIANLKPNHIDEATAAEIKNLYESAYGLDLPYSALLTSLMPKKGRELVDKALKDIGDELLRTLPLSDAAISDAVLTNRELFDLQGKMDDALTSNPALKEYYEKLNLAKRLKEANEQVISAWAEYAMQHKE